jgi:hypothetical protein
MGHTAQGDCFNPDMLSSLLDGIAAELPIVWPPTVSSPGEEVYHSLWQHWSLFTVLGYPLLKELPYIF